MRLEIPQGTETFVAVGLGAVLATLGGFLATLFEARTRERDRERIAAITFGEIAVSLGVMLRSAESSHGKGAPWGLLTLRMFRTARREIDAYERSRTVLSDLRDTDLRLALQALMIRLAIGLDGILEAPDDQERETNLRYLRSITSGIDDIIRRLAPVARQSLAPYEAMPTSPQGFVKPPPDAEGLASFD